MKRILIVGAGGSPATNFVRCLRATGKEYFLVGTDSSKYYLQRSETDKTYLVPEAKDPRYIDILNEIIKENDLEFLHIQNDVEMEILSEKRDLIKIKTFLPSKETVKICQDKFESYKLWKKAGIKQPETMLLKNEGDLKTAFEKYDNHIWIRDTTGAGGRGSIAVTDFKTGKLWMDFKEGWGKYTAAECLTPNSITWMSIWKDGELVVAQSRKRLYWELSKIAVSGITGATGGAITVRDTILDEIALKAIKAIDSKPNGIFSVDLTYDKAGVPNPTEINIGRFFTTHYFFAKAGLNMPQILLDMVEGKELPVFERKINPLEPNLMWIRGMDFEPVFTTVDKVEAEVRKLSERLKKYDK